ncbi:Uncharacterized protein YktB, UPF0637 family [Alkalibacterium subtropicum]|uniref:Uncharacterized protein YktB, UPF0637 family n=1 Tax=Alkalibacterium subtropicum TaxID=753702 RepID=A0A1I1EJZ8_9LACT|nr:DUF1054 family protein [Alkalibacterium subtropicum]SFB85223.1 Uncharacterized protein YktB, UPF0637 family [Alkalibacterium subtropicum]
MKKYFEKSDFNLFTIEGLDERMSVIRESIQPVFQHFGDTYIEDVNEYTGFDGSFHIAQHRRRTTNPPESTWSAIGGNKRGYKKYPHIQIGINEEYIFMFLSLIDNPKHEKLMADYLLNHPTLWNDLPDDYYVSGDHTKTAIEKAGAETVEKTLRRLIKVKKGEIMIGRILTPDSMSLADPDKQEAFFKETLDVLLPIYKELLDLYQEAEAK